MGPRMREDNVGEGERGSRHPRVSTGAGSWGERERFTPIPRLHEGRKGEGICAAERAIFIVMTSGEGGMGPRMREDNEGKGSGSQLGMICGNGFPTPCFGGGLCAGITDREGWVPACARTTGGGGMLKLEAICLNH